jgi:hypothetical protein
MEVTNELAKILATNKLIGGKAIVSLEDEKIRSIMIRGYDFTRARTPGVLALQGIG